MSKRDRNRRLVKALVKGVQSLKSGGTNPYHREPYRSSWAAARAAAEKGDSAGVTIVDGRG